jgi:hypothetical protein
MILFKVLPSNLKPYELAEELVPAIPGCEFLSWLRSNWYGDAGNRCHAGSREAKRSKEKRRLADRQPHPRGSVLRKGETLRNL